MEDEEKSKQTSTEGEKENIKLEMNPGPILSSKNEIENKKFNPKPIRDSEENFNPKPIEDSSKEVSNKEED